MIAAVYMSAENDPLTGGWTGAEKLLPVVQTVAPAVCLAIGQQGGIVGKDEDKTIFKG